MVSIEFPFLKSNWLSSFESNFDRNELTSLVLREHCWDLIVYSTSATYLVMLAIHKADLKKFPTHRADMVKIIINMSENES